VAGALLGAAALVLARPWPLVAVAVALVPFWLSSLDGQLGWLAAFPLAYALYRVGERQPVPASVVALLAGLTGPVATALPAFRHSGAILPFAMLAVTAWTAGVAVRGHHRHTQDLLDHQAHQARAELERSRRELVDERMRIARELHDVVAHGMSVITVQAAFGRLVIDREPATAADALGVIETTGRESSAELRRVLNLLRDDEPADAGPAPGLAGLRELVDKVSAAGVAVRLTIEGMPRPLPPGLELSAYRIVQEALTNVVKHSGAEQAEVNVGYQPDGLVLHILDEGRGGRVTSSGHGLVGMRERVALFGGALDAGPRPEGGFRVSARLPAPAGIPRP
jgi:signal transduction histidine kinase